MHVCMYIYVYMYIRTPRHSSAVVELVVSGTLVYFLIWARKVNLNQNVLFAIRVFTP